MSFSEELPKKSKDQVIKRTSAEYAQFKQEYRSIYRILDVSAKTVWRHFIQQANKGKGLSANCPNVRADMSVCPLEASVRGLPRDDPERKEKTARRRFIVNVLDRTPHAVCSSCGSNSPQTRNKDCVFCGANLSDATFKPLNKIKIMEGGVQLFNQTLNPIDEMQRQDFGDDKDITTYDITFTTQGERRDKKITAIPQQPKELDPSVFLDENGEKQAMFNLDDLAEPNTIEQIQLMLAGAPASEIFAVVQPQESLA